MKTPERSGWSQRTQRGHRRIDQGRLRDQEGDPGADRSPRPGANPSRSGTAPGARRRPRISAGQLALDDQLAEVLVAEPLRGRAGADRRAPRRRPGRARRRSGRTARGRRRGAGRRSAASRRPGPRTGTGSPRSARVAWQARVEAAGPQPGLVHHAQAVGEAAVLGGREDPARALELADPAQALEPGGIEEIVLGGRLGGQAEGARFGRARGAWSARCSRGSGR